MGRYNLYALTQKSLYILGHINRTDGLYKFKTVNNTETRQPHNNVMKSMVIQTTIDNNVTKHGIS